MHNSIPALDPSGLEPWPFDPAVLTRFSFPTLACLRSISVFNVAWGHSETSNAAHEDFQARRQPSA